MRKFALAVVLGIGCLCAGNIYAQEFPQLHLGDTWRFRQTIDAPSKSPVIAISPSYTLEYKNKSGDFILATKSGSNNGINYAGRLIGPVSPKTCLYDVTANAGFSKNCDVKLENGKSWSIDESNTIARTQETVKIGPVEAVEVPAGRYMATKIVSNKTITEFAFNGVPEPTGGYAKKFVTTYWYCPDVKAMVKIIRETSNANGIISIKTDELESYSGGM